MTTLLLSPEADGDALSAMTEHLTGVLGAGAALSSHRPGADGTLVIPAARRPLLRLRLLQPLTDQALIVSSVLQDAATVADLRFAPFTPAGSALVLWVGGEGSDARDCALTASLGGAAVDPGDIAQWIAVDLLEGNLGRVLALLGDEKARLRREAGALQAMRAIGHAADDALDRIGADLAVPRLEGAPAWDAGAGEIISVPGRENDADYRARLKLWRPFVAPTPGAVRALLTGVDSRLQVTESSRSLAVAIKIVGGADDNADATRKYLLDRVRSDWLVFLNDNGPGAATHAARPRPADARAAETAMRGRLMAAYSAPADGAVAPRLAEALDRAARVLIALGAPPLAIVRAQDGAGGSRFELGMGVSLALPSVADADALRDALIDPARVPRDDSLAEAMIRAAAAHPPAAGDRLLGWLWAAAGLPTVHPLDPDHVYLSHLGTTGLTIDTLRVGSRVTVRAVFNAPNDNGQSAALQGAIDRAAAAARPSYAMVAPGDVASALGTVVDPAAGAPANQSLVAAGLIASIGGTQAAQSLQAIPQDLWTLYTLDAPLAAQVLAGDPAAEPAFGAIVAALRASGFVSLLPLVTPAAVLLAAGVVSLPVAGVNLGERTATGARWAMAPLAGQMQPGYASGFATEISVPTGGLVAVVALGYVRDASPDPYEIRVDLAEDGLLDLAGYERVMNALERIFAMGVEVNTWQLRQHHVDLDGDGIADPLTPKFARHYRSFRLPRRRGLEEPEDYSTSSGF